MKTFRPDDSAIDASNSGDLRSRICAAFEGVTLGGGIGLYEAQGIDDHCSEETCRMLRERDEKDNWQRITAEDLNKCYSSLSFFDAEGLRFHLPAYLLADLTGDYMFDMIAEFTNWCDYKKQQYSLLSPTQKSTVLDYLKLIQNKPGNWLKVHKIDFTLESLSESTQDS